MILSNIDTSKLSSLEITLIIKLLEAEIKRRENSIEGIINEATGD